MDFSIKLLVSEAIRTVVNHADWIGWNLFLAFIPLVLSVFLFRRTPIVKTAIEYRHRSLFWWLGVAVFVAFLPNAPYILTDIIHFVNWVRAGASIWVVTLIYVPLFVVFLTAGFEAYVMSLMNAGYYLKQRGLRHYVFPMELTLHALSAIGIFLGRFLRFNSWNILTHWNDVAASLVEDVFDRQPMITIVITFIILTLLYALAKPLHFAMSHYWKFRPQPERSQFVIPNS
ncbi:DUF1361 domain-containing protein [Leptolyngbya boryana CZ1]|uniref:DUF1361 domain-containing protein n=1 Tax=Leptolyngbya boryana CZ1 TaxID=3060204 RepID=A0AA96WWJ2_LEPBY|nr:DUF1361 domain-containing protein [Leptolyngbya boryana]WNZ46368.1 DUF1361 domain-containing protein [Leptolyngbya boryana CZ1]